MARMIFSVDAAKKVVEVIIPSVINSHERTKKAVNSSILIKDLQPRTIEPGYDFPTPEVSVTNQDCLALAQEYHQKNPESRITVLNLGNAYTPGGGFLDGHVAQEECICMHSTLFPSLKKDWYNETAGYPLAATSVIYSPDCLVFRDGTGQPYKVQDRFYIDVITVAAIAKPNLKDGGTAFASTVDENKTKAKITMVMRAAIFGKADILIMGALGCGVFRNPPQVVADLFKSVIESKMEDWSSIQKIDFAVLGGSGQAKRNYDIFKTTLQAKRKGLKKTTQKAQTEGTMSKRSKNKENIQKETQREDEAKGEKLSDPDA